MTHADAISRAEAAVATLERFVAENPSREIEIAGLIQAFELAFEVCWKAFKALAEKEGRRVGGAPRAALEAAFALGWITDEDAWLDMLRDRNNAAHIYSEKMAQAIAKQIVDSHLPRIKEALALLPR